MLEQRRAVEKGYITLKEAAQLTGYTPDYVGQLVRGGKIKGEQVYSGVAWVTTEDEVLSYLSHKGKVLPTTMYQKIPFFERGFFRYFLYCLIAICVVSLLFLQYVLYTSIDARFQKHIDAESVASSFGLIDHS